MADSRYVQAPKVRLTFDYTLWFRLLPDESRPVLPHGLAVLGVPEVDPLLKHAVGGTNVQYPGIDLPTAVIRSVRVNYWTNREGQIAASPDWDDAQKDRIGALMRRIKSTY